MNTDLEASKKGVHPAGTPLPVPTPSAPPPLPPPAISSTAPPPSPSPQPIRPPSPAPRPMSPVAGPAPLNLPTTPHPFSQPLRAPYPSQPPPLSPPRPPTSPPPSTLPPLRTPPLPPPPLSRSTPTERPPFSSSEKPPRAGSRKRIILLSLVALLILLFIAGQIWWFFLRDSEESRPDPDDIIPPLVDEGSPPETVPPPVADPDVAPPLLTFDKTEFLNLNSDAASAILAALDAATRTPRNEEGLIRLVFMVTSTQGESQVPFETLREALGLAIPPGVLSQLGPDYDLFLLPQNVFDETTCNEQGAKDADCAGPRLGLVLRTKDSAALGSSLRSWEPSMVQDLRRLIAATPESTQGSFSSGTYRAISIRYRNLPLSTTTIDYALLGNLLVITTSKSSMYAALDAVAR